MRLFLLASSYTFVRRRSTGGCRNFCAALAPSVRHYLQYSGWISNGSTYWYTRWKWSYIRLVQKFLSLIALSQLPHHLSLWTFFKSNSLWLYSTLWSTLLFSIHHKQVHFQLTHVHDLCGYARGLTIFVVSIKKLSSSSGKKILRR